ncbi:MAG: class I SAM-dependent methyltransferase [Candidatus Verstraetearchaeota archaeon]|nr:class I SAM-dependent methyltransferase [Candidatus Verstraetearchaeota archaeon]
MKGAYNKPFEPEDMRYVEESPNAQGLKETVDELTAKKLKTTAAGDLRYSNLNEKVKYQYTLHPMRLWEYTRIFEICNIQQGMRVLDGGGASSPIVFYCGKKRVDITTLDLQGSLIEDNKKVAKEMGWETITTIKRDMTETGFLDNYFDAVFSVSVFEHLPNEIKIKGIKEFARILRPGGIIGLTFDFGRSVKGRSTYDYNNYEQLHTPIRDVEEIYEFFIRPSGLKLYGNQDLTDKIAPDKEYIRKILRSDIMEGESLKKVLYSIYAYFNSPYFNYTVYSIFLKKE